MWSAPVWSAQAQLAPFQAEAELRPPGPRGGACGGGGRTKKKKSQGRAPLRVRGVALVGSDLNLQLTGQGRSTGLAR